MNHGEKLYILHGLDGCYIVNIMHKFGCNVVIIIIWFLHALTSFFEFFSSEAVNSKTHNHYRRTGEAAKTLEDEIEGPNRRRVKRLSGRATHAGWAFNRCLQIRLGPRKDRPTWIDRIIGYRAAPGHRAKNGRIPSSKPTGNAGPSGHIEAAKLPSGFKQPQPTQFHMKNVCVSLCECQ